MIIVRRRSGSRRRHLPEAPRPLQSLSNPRLRSHESAAGVTGTGVVCQGPRAVTAWASGPARVTACQWASGPARVGGPGGCDAGPGLLSNLLWAQRRSLAPRSGRFTAMWFPARRIGGEGLLSRLGWNAPKLWRSWALES